MGTTATALTDDDAVQLAWVLAIEGVNYLLTDWPVTAAVVTAWAATDWVTAHSGLSVEGQFSQSIEPWSGRIDVGTMQFSIMDYDGADTFGIEVFKTGAGDETLLNANLTASATTVTALATTGFVSGVDIYIGLERIATTGLFGTLTRGKFAPFATTSGVANRFGREHRLPTATIGVHHKPKISELPRLWIGKWVGLWMHRVVGTVLDTKAQAQLMWAGKIAEIQDSSDGSTILLCEDARAALRDTTLLHDQWRAKVADGIYLVTGWKFRALDKRTGLGQLEANTLDVVASGASGVNQINAGLYSADQIYSVVNDWFAAENIANRLRSDWSIGAVFFVGDAGWRTVLTVTAAGAVSTDDTEIYLHAPDNVLQFLGYTTTGAHVRDGVLYSTILGYIGGAGTISLAGNLPLMRAIVKQGAIDIGERTLIIEGEEGQWVNEHNFLPQPWRDEVLAGESWGIVYVGKTVALARRDSATQYTLRYRSDITATFGGEQDRIENIPYGDASEILLRQLVVLQGGVTDIIARLFYSTGAAAYNHATYDDFDSQLGAGIPGELLGTNFLNSLANLQSNSATETMTIVLDEPTALEDVLMSELLLRSAHLVWKNQGLRFTRPHRPAPAGLALHTLTESNKASADPGDAQRMPTQITRQYMRNVFKIDYNRTWPGDKYLDSYTVRFEASIGDYGEQKVVTIKARNSLGASVATVASIKAHAIDLISGVAPLYGRPLRMLTRTIEHKFFDNVAPGDFVSITDSFARDPATGTRGLTAKGGLIIGHRYDFGGNGREILGTADLLIMDLDNNTIYSPAARVDETADTGGFTDGFNSTTKTIRCKASEYSEASEAVDASHFAAGDKIQVIQIDPAVPGTFTSFSDTVGSVSGNDIVVDTGTFTDTAGKLFRVVSAAYTTAVATQKTDAYQADDADALILNARAPYEYGDSFSTIAFTASVSTTLPERHSTGLFGDGQPLASAYHRAAAAMVNNLVSWKTAPSLPLGWVGSITGAGGTDTYRLEMCYPYFVGIGVPPANEQRLFRIAPMLRGSAAGEISCRVTLSRYPPAGNSLVTVTFSQPFVQLSFTHNGTTATTVAAQTALAISELQYGMGYVSIELKGSTGHGASPIFHGLTEFRLGALTAI